MKITIFFFFTLFFFSLLDLLGHVAAHLVAIVRLTAKPNLYQWLAMSFNFYSEFYSKSGRVPYASAMGTFLYHILYNYSRICKYKYISEPTYVSHTGFAWVLENLVNPWIWKRHFPELESPGISSNAWKPLNFPMMISFFVFFVAIMGFFLQ